MSLLPHQLELLAPARNADIGIEAINHGADAVYIGGPAFGARATAGNALADLERLIAHAHRFHSRIFITLNTILRDDELEEARRMIPGVSITTDLIFGFPGETEEDFRRTIAIMERVRFDFAFLYRYSEREGTKACDLPGVGSAIQSSGSWSGWSWLAAYAARKS